MTYKHIQYNWEYKLVDLCDVYGYFKYVGTK